MKKTLKITLSLIMTLALLVVGSPITVLATDGVATHTVDTLDEFTTAISNATDGDIIDVTGDITLTADITITKNITLTSSNGSTITCGGKKIHVGSNTTAGSTQGTLTLNGNLKMTATVSAMINMKYGTVNVEGNVELSTTKGYVIDSSRGAAVASHINITGGTLIGTDTSGDQGAVGFFPGHESTLTISGGTITQSKDTGYAIKIRSRYRTTDNGHKGTITISGGTINGAVAIHGDSNTVNDAKDTYGRVLNITGGTINGNKHGAIYMYSYCMDTQVNISGDATLVAENYTINGYGKNAADSAVQSSSHIQVNISGGVVEATNGSVIYAQNANDFDVNVTGDKLICGGTAEANMINFADSVDANSAATVNGGLFINNNTANTTIFSDNVNYVKGNIIYGENITNINSTTEATKGVTVKYEDNDYNFYTRYAATDAQKGEMLDGASVRLTAGSTGLRFTSEFAKVDGTTYGTIIVPASYLATIDAFTVEALTAKYGENGFLNIVANDGMDVDGDTVTIRAAITNLDTYDNYGTIFAAVSYVIIDGEYYYTAFDMANNARSVAYVANEALADTETDYTEAQEEILRGFLQQD